MLTWRLWRALRYPDEINPLFQRVQAQPSVIPGRRLVRRFAPLAGGITVLVSAVTVVIAPAVLLLMSNVFGALVAFNITHILNREREQGTYDLLALTPLGRGASNWLIAAACASRLNVIERLASLRTLTLTMLILLALYALGGTLITSIPVFVLAFALNLDAIQSQIVGCLSGMLGQEFSDRSATLASLAIFAFVQCIAVYLPTLGTALFVFDFLRLFRLDRWIVEGIVALAALAVLFLTRETIIQVMWRELERRLL